MLRIKYYPLVDADTDGKEKMPMFSTDNEHTVRKTHSAYLMEVIPKCYRLCSVNGISKKEAETYTVHCPICGKVMKPISRPTNKYRLSLYHCVDCMQKEREENKMSIYPLKVNKANMRTLHPMRVVASEEYISSHYDLYLTTEYYNNDNDGQNRYYRLNAIHPHSIDMALAYNIQCPKCDRHTLKQVGRCLDMYKLGLYECPVCDRKAGRR